MKQLRIKLTYIIILCLFSSQLQAQDGYTYSLVDNGSFNYTITAVPNTSANNFATSVQSYGFTIILPDGITATITSSLGNGAGATYFDGSAVGQASIDGYLITETLGSPISLPSPVSGGASPMVDIQLNQSPTSGSISILENNSALATTVTPLKSFMSADMEDDGTAIFTPVVNANASGLSGTTSYTFTTLSIESDELATLSIHPNPAKDVVYISSPEIALTKAEVFNMNGQLVLSTKNNLETIQINKLQSGMYILKLYTENGSKTIKIIKE